MATIQDWSNYLTKLTSVNLAAYYKLVITKKKFPFQLVVNFPIPFELPPQKEPIDLTVKLPDPPVIPTNPPSSKISFEFFLPVPELKTVINTGSRFNINLPEFKLPELAFNFSPPAINLLPDIEYKEEEDAELVTLPVDLNILGEQKPPEPIPPRQDPSAGSQQKVSDDEIKERVKKIREAEANRTKNLRELAIKQQKELQTKAKTLYKVGYPLYLKTLQQSISVFDSFDPVNLGAPNNAQTPTQGASPPANTSARVSPPQLTTMASLNSAPPSGTTPTETPPAGASPTGTPTQRSTRVASAPRPVLKPVPKNNKAKLEKTTTPATPAASTAPTTPAPTEETTKEQTTQVAQNTQQSVPPQQTDLQKLQQKITDDFLKVNLYTTKHRFRLDAASKALSAAIQSGIYVEDIYRSDLNNKLLQANDGLTDVGSLSIESIVGEVDAKNLAFLFKGYDPGSVLSFDWNTATYFVNEQPDRRRDQGARSLFGTNIFAQTTQEQYRTVQEILQRTKEKFVEKRKDFAINYSFLKPTIEQLDKTIAAIGVLQQHILVESLTRKALQDNGFKTTISSEKTPTIVPIIINKTQYDNLVSSITDQHTGIDTSLQTIPKVSDIIDKTFLVVRPQGLTNLSSYFIGSVTDITSDNIPFEPQPVNSNIYVEFQNDQEYVFTHGINPEHNLVLAPNTFNPSDFLPVRRESKIAQLETGAGVYSEARVDNPRSPVQVIRDLGNGDVTEITLRPANYTDEIFPRRVGGDTVHRSIYVSFLYFDDENSPYIQLTPEMRRSVLSEPFIGLQKGIQQETSNLLDRVNRSPFTNSSEAKQLRELLESTQTISEEFIYQKRLAQQSLNNYEDGDFIPIFESEAQIFTPVEQADALRTLSNQHLAKLVEIRNRLVNNPTIPLTKIFGFTANKETFSSKDIEELDKLILKFDILTSYDLATPFPNSYRVYQNPPTGGRTLVEFKSSELQRQKTTKVIQTYRPPRVDLTSTERRGSPIYNRSGQTREIVFTETRTQGSENQFRVTTQYAKNLQTGKVRIIGSSTVEIARSQPQQPDGIPRLPLTRAQKIEARQRVVDENNRRREKERAAAAERAEAAAEAKKPWWQRALGTARKAVGSIKKVPGR